jgi:hypothetical protein
MKWPWSFSCLLLLASTVAAQEAASGIPLPVSVAEVETTPVVEGPISTEFYFPMEEQFGPKGFLTGNHNFPALSAS